jgi:hypothetical protein
MKQTEYRSLGIDVKLNTPDSVAEFDALAKRVDGCLEEATNNVVYRGMLAEFRETFLHGCEKTEDSPAIKGVEERSGIERKFKTVMKDGKTVLRNGEEVTVWAETEGDYFKRVLAELSKKEGKDVPAAHFQTLADEVAASLVFDPTERERKERGPVKLAKMYVEKATEVLTQGRHEKVIQHIQKDLKDTVPVPVLADGDTEEVKTKNINALGHYIKAHISWKEKNSVAKY